jgi:diaminopropionate ammonia-lyase
MADDHGPIAFHRRLPGYAPTRLGDLEPLAVDGARRMVIKLETARFGLPAFKVLGASWASAGLVAAWLGWDGGARRSFEALRRELAHRPIRPTLVAATDGNHGRAVAWSARQLGLAAEIFVPAGTVEARVHAIAGEGARVTIVDDDYDGTVAAAAARAAGDRFLVQDTAVAGHSAVVEEIVHGYSTIFAELDAQLGPTDDRLVVVVPVGVGSLALTAARHYRPRRASTTLVTVEPTEAASLKRSLDEGRLVALPGPHTSCMVGLRCGSISTSAWPELRTAVDEAVAVDDAEADAAMRSLAAEEIDVGECGASALAAVRQLEATGRLERLIGDGPATIALIATEAPTDPERWAAVVGRPPRSA